MRYQAALRSDRTLVFTSTAAARQRHAVQVK
jgi:hypothetical protein